MGDPLPPVSTPSRGSFLKPTAPRKRNKEDEDIEGNLTEQNRVARGGVPAPRPAGQGGIARDRAAIVDRVLSNRRDKRVAAADRELLRRTDGKKGGLGASQGGTGLTGDDAWNANFRTNDQRAAQERTVLGHNGITGASAAEKVAAVNATKRQTAGMPGVLPVTPGVGRRVADPFDENGNVLPGVNTGTPLSSPQSMAPAPARPTRQVAGGTEGMVNPALPDAQKFQNGNQFTVSPKVNLPAGVVASDGTTQYRRAGTGQPTTSVMPAAAPIGPDVQLEPPAAPAAPQMGTPQDGMGLPPAPAPRDGSTPDDFMKVTRATPAAPAAAPAPAQMANPENAGKGFVANFFDYGQNKAAAVTQQQQTRTAAQASLDAEKKGALDRSTASLLKGGYAAGTLKDSAHPAPDDEEEEKNPDDENAES